MKKRLVVFLLFLFLFTEGPQGLAQRKEVKWIFDGYFGWDNDTNLTKYTQEGDDIFNFGTFGDTYFMNAWHILSVYYIDTTQLVNAHISLDVQPTDEVGNISFLEIILTL